MARRLGFRHTLAVVGQPAQDRDYDGPGIRPYIHPSATLEAFAQVDAGTVHQTYISENVWLMKTAHVGHDAYIGPGCELTPGCVVCGHAVLVGANRLGVGALVLPYKRIGRGARIGAGAVVTRNVPPGEVWAGNPARRLPGYYWNGNDEWLEEDVWITSAVS